MAKNITLNSNGSLWNKWDLHVHTPASIENQYEGSNANEKWERFIGDIEKLPQEFKVIGINDYFFIDGYRNILHEWKDKGRMQNIDLFLPVIEFRIRKFCGHKEWNRINYHVIFSNELTPDVIQQQFLNALSSKYKLDPNVNHGYWNGIITPQSVADLGKKIIDNAPASERAKYGSPSREGFNNLNINEEDIAKILKESSYLQGKYITAIGKAEWDQLNWGDNSIAEKKDVINSVDIIFSASKDVESFIKAKRRLSEADVNDLLLDCSDSHHNLSSLDKDRLGNCNTWIKADTTFEGLKQIIYEPDDRISVSEIKPDQKDSYQVIDKVTLNEEGFWKQELRLNPNLNTIIGGRSTGKSTLLSCIANKLQSFDDKNATKNEAEFIDIHTSDVNIQWNDGENLSTRKIDFFPQDYMYSIAIDRNRRNKLLEKIILDNQSLADIKSSYNDKINSIKREIGEKLNLLFELKDKGVEQRAKLKAIGDERGMQNELEQLSKEKMSLESSMKLAKEKIEQYNNLQKEFTQIDKLCGNLLHEKNRLSQLSPIDYAILNPAFDLSVLGEEYRNVLVPFINNSLIATNSNVRAKIEELKNKVEQKLLSFQKQKTTIQNSPLYKESQEFQTSNQKYKVVQERIKNQKEKLETYQKEKQVISNIGKKYKEIFDNIIESVVSFQNETQKISQILNIQHDGIFIKGMVDGMSDMLRQRLETLLDQRSSFNKDLINDLCEAIVGERDLKDSVHDILTYIMNGKVTFRSNVTPLMSSNSILSENWFGINYSASYEGDDFEGMSRGKQAFVILKLLLDFSQSKCPILIDQPEDSLDNRAIFTDLVKYLKKKKKERQIILVTHNANVVVGADSELIIVANQNGNNTPNANGVKFQYIAGSLENTFVNKDKTEETPVLSRCGIREHVCDIVEGGKDAFIQRERKYGL
jgi:predicted ATPase